MEILAIDRWVLSLAKLKPQDVSFFFSAIKPITWVLMPDEQHKAAAFSIGVLGVKII